MNFLLICIDCMIFIKQNNFETFETFTNVFIYVSFAMTQLIKGLM